MSSASVSSSLADLTSDTDNLDSQLDNASIVPTASAATDPAAGSNAQAVSEPDSFERVEDIIVDLEPPTYDIQSVSSFLIEPLPVANPDFYKHFITEQLHDCTYLDQRARISSDRVQERLKPQHKSVLQRAEEKKSLTERQLEESDKQLSELLRFSETLISNIAVASEKRECLRRENETNNRSSLERDLKGEASDAMLRYDEIMKRWKELEGLREPVTLFEEMEKQKQSVAELMRGKDEMITECQKEIDRIDQLFFAEQQKQNDEMQCIVHRIDSQVDLVKMAYNEHLEILSLTILAERQNIALEAKNKWQHFSNMMNQHEERKFKVSQEKSTFYEHQIERISQKQEEITHATRMRMERDGEKLECELRNIRNSAQINSEKLDYNYQILKKRNEENVIINNQQKRRVAKLVENISALKQKIVNAHVNAVSVANRMHYEIQKLHANISDLEKKSAQFRLNNVQLFSRVWECNYNDLQALLQHVFNIDKTLYEQVLIKPWTPLEVDKMTFKFSHKSGRKSSCTQRAKALSAAKQMEALENKRLLRNILRLVADRAGVLVESRVLKILKPYSKGDKSLVRLQNIFDALNINNMQLVASLTEFFMPYTYCPNCQFGIDVFDLQKLFQFKPDDPLKIPPQKKSLKVIRKPKCPKHYEVIEPSMVLTALNEYTKHQLELKVLQAKDSSQKQADYSNELLALDIDVIRNYWKKFGTYMKEDKRKIWSAMEHVLNHYLDVLKQREVLENECIFLRQQNVELKHLLQAFDV